MSVVQGVMSDRLDQILDDSIRNCTPVVLTHRTPAGWRMFKGRFHAGNKLDGDVSVQIPLTAEFDQACTPKPGETIGVTFRLGHRKCMSSSTILSVHSAEETLTITFKWMDQLQQLQRRVFERAEPPRGTVVAVRFWIEEPGSDLQSQERVVKHGQMEDISAGGMRIKAGETADVVMGATYRCVFTPRQGAPAYLLDATLRHREAGDRGRVSLGFQFVGFETSAEGRKTLERLARLVTQFHRSASRRHRSPNDNSNES